MISAILALCLAAAASGQDLFGPQFAGDLTYYATAAPPAFGHCSFPETLLPWSTNIKNFIALNAPQYGDSQPCGLCLRASGTGAGSGLTPPGTADFFVQVSDECPECQSGDVDVAAPGDGRWGVSWTAVQCDVGDSPFTYSFQGSNPWYIKVAVLNTRVPVASVTLGGAQLQRTVDNFFQLFSGTQVAFPADVQVTSVFGATVSDTIPTFASDGLVGGAAQFPLQDGVPTVGQGAGTESSRAEAPQAKQGRPVQPPALPNATCTSAVQPHSQCGGRGGVCHQCVDRKWNGACCSTGFQCVRKNAWWYQCDPEPTGGIESAGLPVIDDYQGCGGLELAGVDGPLTNATCSANFQCTRWDPHYWQCRDVPVFSTSAGSNSTPLEFASGELVPLPTATPAPAPEGAIESAAPAVTGRTVDQAACT